MSACALASLEPSSCSAEVPERAPPLCANGNAHEESSFVKIMTSCLTACVESARQTIHMACLHTTYPT